MKKGQVYEGIVERIDFPNKGKVYLTEEECYVTVKNTIPKQKVKFVVNKFKRGDVEGRLLEVLESSPLEKRKSVCSIFPACGGCTYQTMSYDSQLAMKEEQVRRIMDEAIQGEYIFEGILPNPQEFRYRNKMEFSFGDEYKDGPLSLGLHKKGSMYDILTAGDCKLVHEDMTKILLCVLEYFKERQVSYYKKMQHVGYLRHLLLRRGDTTGEVLVNLVTTSQENHNLQPLVHALRKLSLEGRIVGILHILNDSLSDVVQSDEIRVLYGQDYFHEILLGLQFKITPFSFFQPNTKGAEVLYTMVRGFIMKSVLSCNAEMQGVEEKPEPEQGRECKQVQELSDICMRDLTVFDLFSGTGTIAQVLAPLVKQVIGVELVEEAVIAARENVAQNRLDNCRFIAGDVFQVLDEIEEKPDVIILDPPRDGIHPKALPKILAYGVERIVYISCKPTSLARDLAVIQEAGYRVERLIGVDQFSQTVHVEVVCFLVKRQ